MDTQEAPWPAALTLLLADSELGRAGRSGSEAWIELASAQVQWPSLSQCQPQQGWIWPLRLQFSELVAWEARALTPGRIVQAGLQLNGQALSPLLPAHHQGCLCLSLELVHGGSLSLQAGTLRITLDGARLGESLSC